MPQGGVKKSKTSTGTSKRSSASAPKKGHRSIAPKRKALAVQHKITKKYNASMIGRTERSLAEKAGRLEMLGEGKKKSKAGGMKTKTPQATKQK